MHHCTLNRQECSHDATLPKFHAKSADNTYILIEITCLQEGVKTEQKGEGALWPKLYQQSLQPETD
jgi:uncharacterized protein (DUF952 family)